PRALSDGIRDRGAHASAADHAAQALGPHEPLHRAARRPVPLAPELPPDLPRAVDAAMGAPEAIDLAAELGVALDPGRLPGRIRLPSLGLVVGRRSDRQDPADRLDSVLVTMTVDERHHHGPRRSSSAWAKYADALRRISFARR